MEKNWKSILSSIINKMEFLRGRISHRITKRRFSKPEIDSFIVDFQTLDFEYYDPFYGDSNSVGNFNIFFETVPYQKRIVLDNILQIENEFYDFRDNPMIGCFSNSVDLKILYCKFGNIEGSKIEFEMKFYLTNSDSYAMLDGTEKEHSTLHKTVNIDLTFEDLIVQTSKSNEEKPVRNFLDQSIYDVDLIQKHDEINWSRDVKYYKIPFKKETLL